MTTINFLIFYVACGVLAYGATFAYFQGRSPKVAATDYRRDMSASMAVGILGPVGLFMALVFSGFFEFGFKYK